mgnify:CR=1 FL=1
MEQPVKLAPFFTPTGPAAETMIEKKSRFTGRIWPVETEEEALAHIKKTRDEFWDATHNVYAYIIKGGATRYSDDGEPGGTAGMPVLNVLRQAEISNVCCVVTRYFGGTLLGAGGLVRAYGRAAKLALDAAGICKMQPWLRQTVSAPYALFEQVKLLIAAQAGVLEDAQYGADILVTYRIPAGADEALRTALREASSGTIAPQLLEEIFCAG